MHLVALAGMVQVVIQVDTQVIIIIVKNVHREHAREGQKEHSGEHVVVYFGGIAQHKDVEQEHTHSKHDIRAGRAVTNPISPKPHKHSDPHHLHPVSEQQRGSSRQTAAGYDAHRSLQKAEISTS